jgi:hypothetical protein
MAVLYTNNAVSALSASISNVATSFSVTSGHGVKFPVTSASDYFYVTLYDSAGNIEIVKVTTRATDTFTVTRAQDGTTALAFSAADKVELRVTKAVLDDIKTDTKSSLSSGNVTTALGFTPYNATNPNNYISSSGVVVKDANGNITTNATFNGFTSVAASGTAITLTAASTPVYSITGSGGQVIQLPNATTLPNGTIFSFNNNQSSGAITVNNASATLVVSVPSGGYTTVVLLSNAISAGSWDRHDQTPGNVSWSTNTFDYPGSITNATWNGVAIAASRGGTGVANNSASTITISGAFATTLTVSGTTAITLPTTGTLSTLAGTETLTNKRIQPRVLSAASSTTFAVNADSYDVAEMTMTGVAGTLAISNPTGTPVNGQKLIYKLQCTNAQTYNWGTIFQGSTDLALPTACSGSSKWDYYGFIYNSTATKWQLIAKMAGF